MNGYKKIIAFVDLENFEVKFLFPNEIVFKISNKVPLSLNLSIIEDDCVYKINKNDYNQIRNKFLNMLNIYKYYDFDVDYTFMLFNNNLKLITNYYDNEYLMIKSGN
jgi:hypothetical protein